MTDETSVFNVLDVLWRIKARSHRTRLRADRVRCERLLTVRTRSSAIAEVLCDAKVAILFFVVWI